MEIKRERYLKALVERMHNGMIKVVSGIRRCGKSYLIFKFFRDYLLAQGIDEKHIITIELDQRKNKIYRDPDVILDYIDTLLTHMNYHHLIYINYLQTRNNIIFCWTKYKCW